MLRRLTRYVGSDVKTAEVLRPYWLGAPTRSTEAASAERARCASRRYSVARLPQRGGPTPAIDYRILARTRGRGLQRLPSRLTAPSLLFVPRGERRREQTNLSRFSILSLARSLTRSRLPSIRSNDCENARSGTLRPRVRSLFVTRG